MICERLSSTEMSDSALLSGPSFKVLQFRSPITMIGLLSTRALL